MNDIQRHRWPGRGWFIAEADHVEALRQADQSHKRIVPGGGLAGYSEGYAVGQRDEATKWKRLITDRISDLQSCGKPDDCMGKADILLVILDDYDYSEKGDSNA